MGSPGTTAGDPNTCSYGRLLESPLLHEKEKVAPYEYRQGKFLISAILH
jgi:hypothetical protein